MGLAPVRSALDSRRRRRRSAQRQHPPHGLENRFGMLLRGDAGQSVNPGIERARRELAGGQAQDDRCARREGTDPPHQLAVAHAGHGCAEQDQPEAGDGEHLERSFQALLMPQPDVRLEDTMNEGVHEERFQRVPLQQEDRGQTERGFPESINLR
jgi:hypothetical protein